MNKALEILLHTLPVIGMVLLVPLIKNDYLLTFVYICIIIMLLLIKRNKNEVYIFIFGFFAMIFFETIFIRTGVEVFIRNSLFGIMPLWLPFLWGYGFIAIKRGTDALTK